MFEKLVVSWGCLVTIPQMTPSPPPSWLGVKCHIVFVAQANGRSVWVVDASGENLRCLSRDPFQATTRQSPFRSTRKDNTLLVTQEDSQGFRVGSLSVRGASQSLVHQRATTGDPPEVSPDGRYVAIISQEADHGPTLRITDLNSPTMHNSWFVDEPATQPVWSPDGSCVAYVNAGLWVVGSDGWRRRRLIHEDQGRVFAPRWSADGRRILYARHVLYGDALDVVIGGEPKLVDLFTIGVEDGSVVRLTRERQVSSRMREDDLGGVWSPDGKRVAYTARVNGRNQLFVCGSDGSNSEQLTPGPLRSFNPQWTADGTQVVFARETPSGKRDLAVINVDGTGLRLFRIEELDVFWPICLPHLKGPR